MNQPLTTTSRHMQAAWGHALEAALCTIAMLVLPTASRAVTVVGEPDAYLDYIESTGEQYIDTGVNAETGLKARLDMEWGAVVKPLSTGGDDWSMLDARKTSGECKIFKKNAAAGGFDLERHFIPARKNGYVGLYDKAGGIFYSSDSGTDFIAGAELPRPAAMVEWVKADGSMTSSVAQQYVDTGVWGKLGLKSEVDVTLLENSGDHAILAARRYGTG